MNLPNLFPDQFPEFFKAVHGYSPFLWQTRLAKGVLSTGVWPELVSLPTSAGKTALIDVAIFALACEAHLPPMQRRAPLRILFVIDRRVVADEAFRRAKKIREVLEEAASKKKTGTILQTVAERLANLAGPDALPLYCALLRGGIAVDDEWIRSPRQPTVCVSTVDQIGSRLLFRGYGVPARQRSMHAALIAHDSLLIVDEAHISKAFCGTVKAVQKHALCAQCPIIRPLKLVQMTATAAEDNKSFILQPNEAAEPELQKRIIRKKPTSLDLVAEAADEHSQPALVARAVACAKEWAKKRPRVIGIVVNRVLTARRIFEALDRHNAQKVLFIGRIRPLDRDRLWKKWRQYLTSDPKKRRSTGETLFVVATQTIEVGADLDFDALISELAPLDALRQRFGRLNRRGRDIEVEAFILASKEQTGIRYEDPVYAKTLAPTWKWLQSQLEGKGKKIDFAYVNLKARLETTDTKVIEAMKLPVPRVPMLHPPFLDAWACTASPLMHDPDVAPFLHGEQPPTLEVQIVWRADLDDTIFQSGPLRSNDYRDRERKTCEMVQLVPPSTREALPIPLRTAVRWLQQLASLELTDTANSSDREPARDHSFRPVIVWRGRDFVKVVRNATAIRPGDVLIVPSSYGGADSFGWIGTSAKSGPVHDLAEEAAWQTGRAPFLRLHADVLKQSGVTVPTELIKAAQSEETDTQWKDWVATLVKAPVEPNEAPNWRERLTILSNLKPSEVEVVRERHYPGAILRSRRSFDPLTSLWADDGRDEASQIFNPLPILLDTHLKGVSQKVIDYGKQAGITDSLLTCLSLAASLHDVGKADPRTQVVFYGSELPAFAAVKAGQLLAKSNQRFDTTSVYREIYRLSELPQGARHETLSVFLAELELRQRDDAGDKDLLLHLIAAHHGYARPFLKPLAKPDTEPDVVDLRPLGLAYAGPASYEAAEIASNVPERFFHLQRRYGWWGLAWLETLLRLADWKQSADEQEPLPKPA